MARKIIGVEQWISKNGVSCAVIHCTTEFASSANVNGRNASGTKVEPVRCYREDADSVRANWVGKTLEGYFGRDKNGNTVVQSPCCK